MNEGYRLPFFTTPDPIFQFNHRSAIDNASFVEASIAELLRDRCIVEGDDCPTVCSPLQVVSSATGKRRLVIDLPYVNQFLWKDKFKYEGLDLVPQMFKRGEYFFTFDLKSGYHHVDINGVFLVFHGVLVHHEDGSNFVCFRSVWLSGVARNFRLLGDSWGTQ